MRVLRSRQRVSHNGWRLHYIKNSLDDVPRFAVVVAKRHARAAVTRNRLRRLLREYFRQELRTNLPSMDFLMQSTAVQPLPVDSAALRAECRHLFSQAMNKPL